MSHPADKHKDRTLNGRPTRSGTQPANPKHGSAEQIWENLVDWVHQAGGFVHPSLQLAGHGPSRGIETIGPIQQGDLLIRIPPSCVISGMHVPSKVDGTPASPWLRCLGALLQAKRESSSNLATSKQALPNPSLTCSTPYIESLPSKDEYETLFQWSVSDIQKFLGGTTLGKVLLLDRNEKSLERRYRLGVEPFLKHLGVLEKKKRNKRKRSGEGEEEVLDDLVTSPDYEAFLEASMCISTRGFHLMNEDEDQDQKQSDHPIEVPYNGPFLLPVIDLLNHDPEKACTTLQRDSSSGNFTMIAERHLVPGEAVVHSYGNELTSAQLLQTFGFVPASHSKRILEPSQSSPSPSSLTPVSLHKIDHLIRACLIIKSSIYPKEIQNCLMQRRVGQDGPWNGSNDDEFWDVEDIPDRKMANSMPDEFLVSLTLKDTARESLLTEDLISLLAIQFLPEDAFVEIFQNESSTTRLDLSILEDDPYLGMLSCHSLLMALSLKLEEYALRLSNANGKSPPPGSGGTKSTESIVSFAPLLLRDIESARNGDLSRLSVLMATTPRASEADRELFGRTIRAEELTNLLALTKEVADIFKKLMP
jgi:SET domain